MDDPRYEAGMKVRREVLGDEHVDRATGQRHRLQPPVPGVHHPLRLGRGVDARRAWTARPAPASRSRSSPRCAPRTRSRCTSAPRSRNGLTPEEILEVLIHTAVYAGVPAANSAVAIAQKTLELERARASTSSSRSSAGSR